MNLYSICAIVVVKWAYFECTLSEIYDSALYVHFFILLFATCLLVHCALSAIVTAVLVKLAPGEARRGRPDTIRSPFPVISGASKCDGDCDDP